MEKFKKKIVFSPAFNKIAEGYGRGAVVCSFYLSGKKGAIQFKFFTNWFLPTDTIPNEIKPSGMDIGYHSPIPQYEDQQPMDGECPLLKKLGYEGNCYYDGSTLGADEYLETLLTKGSDAVWKKMKKYYFKRFGKDDSSEKPTDKVEMWEV